MSCPSFPYVAEGSQRRFSTMYQSKQVVISDSTEMVENICDSFLVVSAMWFSFNKSRTDWYGAYTSPANVCKVLT